MDDEDEFEERDPPGPWLAIVLLVCLVFWTCVARLVVS